MKDHSVSAGSREDQSFQFFLQVPGGDMSEETRYVNKSAGGPQKLLTRFLSIMFSSP